MRIEDVLELCDIERLEVSRRLRWHGHEKRRTEGNDLQRMLKEELLEEWTSRRLPNTWIRYLDICRIWELRKRVFYIE